MKTELETGMEWLMNKKPEISFLILLLFFSGSVVGSYYALVNRTDKIETRLDHVENRIDTLERECKDIHAEMKDFRKEADQRFDKVEGELVDIKLILKKIDTYLSTKDPNYK